MTEAQKIDPECWYSTAQLAKILQCSKSKLEQLRTKGDGLPYKQFVGQVRYKGADVIEWLDKQTRTSTATG